MVDRVSLLLRRQSLLLCADVLLDLLRGLLLRLVVLLLQLPGMPLLQGCCKPGRVGLFYVRPRGHFAKRDQADAHSGEGRRTAEQVMTNGFSENSAVDNEAVMLFRLA